MCIPVISFQLTRMLHSGPTHFLTTRPKRASLIYPVMQYASTVTATSGSIVATTDPAITGAISAVL